MGGGGGVYNNSSSSTVTNCIFSGNSAYNGGGGMFNGGGTITNCTFTGNMVTAIGSGGGLSNGSGTVTHCTFNGNSADWVGGGVSNATGTITGCSFSGNSAGEGGGLSNGSGRITGCTFSGNMARGGGGGMYSGGWMYSSSGGTVTDCTFNGNSADWWGGGMGIEGSPTVTNCMFIANSAGQKGGGMSCATSCIPNCGDSPILINCAFIGNLASDSGGGINIRSSNPNVTNCTFSGNSADYYGGGMDNYDSSPTVTNCILWGNTASVDGNEIALWESSTIDVNYCDVMGAQAAIFNDGTGTVNWGSGNIDDDPLFVGPGVGDLRLLPASPCIDAGDNNSVPPDINDLDGDGNTTEPIPFDLDSNPRVVDGDDDGNSVVDMGAYEANYVETAMKFTPQALNLKSKGKWLKAHFVLPEGFLSEDVDTNTPAVIAPLGITSDHIKVLINEDGLVEIKAAFSHSDFCGSATSNDGTEVIVIGLLNSGQNFYGTDTIRIIDKSFEYVAVLAAHWLEAGCVEPDWCSGADLDQDTVVNFVDFALFDGCCIEVIEE